MLAPADRSAWNLRRIINSTEYDVLYLNSLFNPVFTLLPLLLWQTGLLRGTSLVIAPRGELSARRVANQESSKAHLLGDGSRSALVQPGLLAGV